MLPIDTPKLRDVVSDVFIIAHNEDIENLERAISKEGFNSSVIRGPYSKQQSQLIPHLRCLVNHSNAWQKVIDMDGYVIIVEADFVPVIGFSDLPMPFKPSTDAKEMAWLYSCGPVIYHVDRQTKAIFGHNAGTVAYVLNNKCALELLSLFKEEINSQNCGYRPWEVHIPIKLRKKCGVRTYIPHRMYGEHGGLTNPEHQSNSVRGWHEADRLAGSLHFLPTYAGNNRLLFRLRRLRGWARGIYRLIAGKYFDGWRSWSNSGNDRYLKLRLAVQRLL